MFRDRAGESGFSKSPQLILDSLPDIEGLGGPSLYGHLSLSAVLLNSVISMHLFPCFHLQHSASSRIISRVCQLLLTFTAPCHPLSQQHQHPGSEATEPELAQPSSSLSSEADVPLCAAPPQPPAPTSLTVPQKLPCGCTRWPSSLPLPWTICTCCLFFSGLVPTSCASRTHIFI